jgi:ABC-2 type transport system permease protein
MTNLRIFFVGGLLSYRALFGWLNPFISVPLLVVAPLFQVLFFAFLGRAAGLESDRFYVIGNALQLASIPALFAMASAIDGERRAHTLSSILATPANRAALFLGRSLPVIANAIVVSAIALGLGALILHTSIPLRSLPGITLAIVITSISCTGFGLLNAGVGLRIRSGIVLTNMLDAVLLVFCGVNIPLHDLPPWMSSTAQALPVTHGLEAARRSAAGEPLSQVAGLLATELAIGAAYAAAGYVVLLFFERQGRLHATLETA